MAFNFDEKRDMFEIYLSNNKNSTVACAAYREKYPNRRTPHRTIFRKLYNNFVRNGSITKSKTRKNIVLTEEQKGIIVQYFENNRSNSIRDGVRDLRICYGSIQKTLTASNFKPFKVMPLQMLNNDDFPKRRQFCRTLLDRQLLNNNFLKQILWTDEASFTTSGRFNRKNTHVWAQENPHAYQQIQHQGRQSIGVWCGIIDNRVIGPIFFNGNLNSAQYLQLLENEIDLLLDELPLRIMMNAVWQQDGAPIHNSNRVTNFLSERYPLWIGKSGQIRWPPRSPDLTPLDYFLWGHLKNKVYKDRPQNIEELKVKIRDEINLINNNPSIIRKCRNNLVKRIRLCLQQNGNVFEHLLQ